MQVLVKTRHTKITMEGEISPDVLSALKNAYGKDVRIIDDPAEEIMDVTETEWYKTTKKNITPGACMRYYREIHGMTQEQLGQKLGGIPRQLISNMETGQRKINIETAKKLALLFDLPVDRFI